MSSSTIVFQTRVALTGVAANDWSAPITYALAASPGETASNSIDDDGDGLVDERRITRTQSGLTTVLADGVQALTFTRAPSADSVTVLLALARPGDAPSAPQVVSVTTRIALRNRP